MPKPAALADPNPQLTHRDRVVEPHRLRRVREVTSSPPCWASFCHARLSAWPRLRVGRSCSPGATRNTLVVLPLAFALPDALTIAAVVVVTQTLVEVVGMEIYVRMVPRLLPDHR
jgi:hypothetical protein